MRPFPARRSRLARIALLACPLALLSLFGGQAQAEPELMKAVPRYNVAALAPNVQVNVTVQIALEAPRLPVRRVRPPVAVSLVIDRSGSMDEAKKIDYAKRAGKLLVQNLGPEDQLALIVFDNVVEVLFPLGRVTDKKALLGMIDRIRPGGTTFLSGGLEKGIAQLRSIRKEGPCRVILLSDGLANRGVTDPELVAAIGARAGNDGVGVSTIGLGLDFSEDMMQLLAQRGSGQYYYVRDSEDLPAVFRQELALVADSFTRDIRAAFIPAKEVGAVKVYGYSARPEAGGTAIDLSDFSSGETRQMLLHLSLTAGSSPGRQHLGVLRLNYTDLRDGEKREFSLPLELDIVADEGARRAAEQAKEAEVRSVREEVLLLEAEEAHVQALDELRQGNLDKAKGILQAKQAELAGAAPKNAVIAAKVARMAADEQAMSQPALSPSAQAGMQKSAKFSAYQSAKGSNQGKLLKSGDSGFLVEKLENALKKAGFYTRDAGGKYGPEVEAAVRAFQKSRSFTVDGVAGPETLKALGL
ncbi:MAG: VWA domain-containing protein [Deltaproteobacteria bacterium]|jgi:Ca-activated chloride channel family protein|nr:VWA domain-containing protein [Deltaproteobacteria bacterium]